MLKKLLLLVLIALVVGTVSLPFLALEDQSDVQGGARLNATEFDRAKALLRRNDPRRLDAGEVVTQWVDEQELSLISNYALSQLGQGAVAVELHPGRAYTQVSLRIPENPIGRYVNFAAILSQRSGALNVEHLSLGAITLTGWLAEPLRRRGHRELLRIPEYRAVMESINGIQILENRMVMIYQWQPNLIDQLKSRGQALVVDDALKERLVAYSSQISTIANQSGMPVRVSLAEFLTPMFVLADARGGDPVEENRAALLALSFYFSGVDVARMLGVQLPERRRVSKRLTLSGRYDFVQHFLTSAALSVTGGGGVADAIGLFKELDDAKGGSGFSFTDLGADRAGVRLAQLAVDSSSAARVQRFLAGGVSESDFIPDFLDLPEFLTDDEFEGRYGGVGGTRYNELLGEIESRIDGCRLYN